MSKLKRGYQAGALSEFCAKGGPPFERDDPPCAFLHTATAKTPMTWVAATNLTAIPPEGSGE